VRLLSPSEQPTTSAHTSKGRSCLPLLETTLRLARSTDKLPRTSAACVHEARRGASSSTASLRQAAFTMHETTVHAPTNSSCQVVFSQQNTTHCKPSSLTFLGFGSALPAACQSSPDSPDHLRPLMRKPPHDHKSATVGEAGKEDAAADAQQGDQGAPHTAAAQEHAH
ncbi:MAG: hypothetical protein BJ554DRAFT_3070, partial [Olpidium bornovanus]